MPSTCGLISLNDFSYRVSNELAFLANRNLKLPVYNLIIDIITNPIPLNFSVFDFLNTIHSISVELFAVLNLI